MDAAKSLLMDQGAAAVWAAAVAGFSSAAGAAIGAVLAGRSARETVVQTAVEERGHRHEERRLESYAAFRSKVSAAIQALDEAVQALRDGQHVTQETFAKAIRAVWLSHQEDVWPCAQPQVINAAAAVHNCLDRASEAVASLLAHPEDARDEHTPRMQRWAHHVEEVSMAYTLFSTCAGEATYGT
ncbi:hypothetical protein [Streptomyces sp. S465]|uniref:hypothetical protein n=1 Tax=Streptomyces sp. S465 TaxID=2979468 RepID=UPI0022A81CD4|nr:hypothetical protein [Streptomyces sp. S465]WAP57984.1 hypothetical protein N6H00_25185 [Streptomyces sp. S465]